MAVYKCSVCGYIFDEEKEGKKIDELDACPVCKQPVDKFELVQADEEHLDEDIVDTDEVEQDSKEVEQEEPIDLSYDKTYVRQDASCRYMEEIHQMAVSGKSISGAMSTKMAMWIVNSKLNNFFKGIHSELNWC